MKLSYFRNIRHLFLILTIVNKSSKTRIYTLCLDKEKFVIIVDLRCFLKAIC